MLPGDFIAMKLTGEITTSISALSEGIFWDFKQQQLSDDVFNYYGFDKTVIPTIKDVFTVHGTITNDVAEKLSLNNKVTITYKAGDQPNNALSLNVLRPGEVAATAGTSGVIYGVSQELEYDAASRINSFAHVNYEINKRRIGVLLCINGAGIFNRWMKNRAGLNYTYEGLNKEAAKITPGAEGLFALPFGNGAERMLNNQIIGGHFLDIDFNVHTTAHMVRSVQESIAFAFRYGLDIMRENGIAPTVVRAGKANMFLSDVFTEAFTSVNNLSVEFYDGDGSYGAAIGAGIGAGVYANAESAFVSRNATAITEPAQAAVYNDLYEQWKEKLEEKINSMDKEGTLSFSFT
jgi:xylulokinase